MIKRKKTRKTWPDEAISQYTGFYSDSYLSFASDDKIRQISASGGTVSALLLFALEKKLIDGAMVCKTVITEGKVRPQFFIAKTREEILAARGSKYVATQFTKEAIPLIREFQGSLAVVGLPCDITILQNIIQKDTLLKQKVVFTIALFCGHNSQPELIDHVVAKLENQAQSKVKSYLFRTGHWRGALRIIFENGQTVEKPFSYFSLYQNLYFFAEKKCLYCYDHFGYGADIAIGDLWSLEYKNDPIKYSGVIVKTETGKRMMNQCIEAGYLQAQPVSIQKIMNGQKRTALFHYNLSARHRAGKLFGLEIPDKIRQKVSWHNYLAALIVLFNWKWSQSRRFSRLIWKTPRMVFKVYLYIFKALESIR